MDMSDGTITNNEAARYGGGVYVQHIENAVSGQGFHKTGGSVTSNRSGRAGSENFGGNIPGSAPMAAAFDSLDIGEFEVYNLTLTPKKWNRPRKAAL
jgi:hypothetical protein